MIDRRTKNAEIFRDTEWRYMGKYYISKQSIINYLATDKAFKNTQKTPWHIAVIERFLERN